MIEIRYKRRYFKDHVYKLMTYVTSQRCLVQAVGIP